MDLLCISFHYKRYDASILWLHNFVSLPPPDSLDDEETAKALSNLHRNRVEKRKKINEAWKCLLRMSDCYRSLQKLWASFKHLCLLVFFSCFPGRHWHQSNLNSPRVTARRLFEKIVFVIILMIAEHLRKLIEWSFPPLRNYEPFLCVLFPISSLLVSPPLLSPHSYFTKLFLFHFSCYLMMTNSLRLFLFFCFHFLSAFLFADVSYISRISFRICWKLF